MGFQQPLRRVPPTFLPTCRQKAAGKSAPAIGSSRRVDFQEIPSLCYSPFPILPCLFSSLWALARESSKEVSPKKGMLSLWCPGAQKGILESSKRDKKTSAQDQADILRDVGGGRLGNAGVGYGAPALTAGFLASSFRIFKGSKPSLTGHVRRSDVHHSAPGPQPLSPSAPGCSPNSLPLPRPTYLRLSRALAVGL